jgi:hypothetical protein
MADGDNGQAVGGQETGGASGTGAGAGTGTAGAAATTGTQGQTQGQQGQTGQSSTGTAPSGFTYQEDRSKWIPQHRFNEVNQRAQQASQLEGQLREAQQRIQALAGVAPSDANSEKAQQIREAFFNLPGMGALRRLAEMSDDQLDALSQVPEQLQNTSQAEARQWARHGDTTVGNISEQVAEAIGTDTLDADQQSDLRTSFASWLRGKINAEMQTNGIARIEDTSTLQRYENGDPKLQQEFVARYTKNWVEPARRTQTARTATRTRPVPNSAGRSQVTSIQRPEKFKTLDERLDYALGRAKEMGVQFGR